MNTNQVEVVFKQELSGRNALHFWLGFAAICFGIWLWLNGWFSACAVEFNVAPPKLQESFQARAAEGFAGPSTNGYGSTGFVSLAFDTVCLLGWGLSIAFLVMRKGLVAILERLGFVTGGLYQWAANQKEQPAQIKQFESKVVNSLKNHEGRLRTVEGKTAELPEPPPPPEPKSPEELAKEQAEELAELRKVVAELKEQSTTQTTTRRRSTTKKE